MKLYKGRASNAWEDRQNNRLRTVVCLVIIILCFLLVAWIDNPADYHIIIH